MQRQRLSRTFQTIQKSRSLEPVIGTSNYIINNSLHYSIQPKRTNFDINIYMQLHRKLQRKAIIQKKFEQSLYEFTNQIDYTRKGFKGKLIHETFQPRSVSNRQKGVLNNRSPAARQMHSSFFSTQPNMIRESESGLKLNTVAQSSHLKPNMMYNLNLYRKSYKREIKQESKCLVMVENLSKTRDSTSINSTLRRSKKMMTIS